MNRANEMPQTNTSNAHSATRCPCGSNKEYAQCCEPLHQGAPASSAEALMRSRYSAFAMNLLDYIDRSWHSSTRPKPGGPEGGDANRTRWMGLRIKRHEVIDANRAIVEFSARYEARGRVSVMHEVSRFVLENGHWFYIDGTFPRR